MTTTYRTRGEAILARIKADEHAEQIRQRLVEKISDYGMAMMALGDTHSETPFRERHEKTSALFTEILALTHQVRDARKEA